MTRTRSGGLAAAVLALLLVLPTAVAQTETPQEACDAALNGAPVMDGVARLGVGFVCEARPAGAPPAAGGEYGYGTIHLWPVGLQPAVIRKLAGHELGHAWSSQRPDVTADWYALRGSSGTSGQEDFAEDFYLANYREPGLSWVTYGGLPVVSEDQLAVMRGWWNGPAVAPVGPTVAPQRPVEEPATVVPAAVAAPVVVAVPAEPRVTTMPETPAVVVALEQVPRPRVRAVLDALRVAGF